MIETRGKPGYAPGAPARRSGSFPVLVMTAAVVFPAPAPAGGGDGPAQISVVRNEAAEPRDGQVYAAYQAYREGNREQARYGYEQVLRADPDNRDAMLGLAACAVRDGDTRTATSMYRRIIHAFPRDVMSRAALIGLQRDRRGEPVIRELLAGQPDNPFLHLVLGQLLAGQSRWDEARQVFYEARRIDAANPVYTLNLAISLDRLGQRDQALAYYRATLRLVERGASDLDIRPVIRRIQSLRRP